MWMWGNSDLQNLLKRYTNDDYTIHFLTGFAFVSIRHFKLYMLEIGCLANGYYKNFLGFSCLGIRMRLSKRSYF